MEELEVEYAYRPFVVARPMGYFIGGTRPPKGGTGKATSGVLSAYPRGKDRKPCPLCGQRERKHIDHRKCLGLHG